MNASHNIALRVLSIIGVIAILTTLTIFSYNYGYKSGYTKGITPTAEETKNAKLREQAINDIYTVSTKYEEVYNICETKYQTALNGDLNEAFIYKGKQDAIEADINSILDKYSEDNTGTKDLYLQ